MFFFLLILICLSMGILTCMPLARYISPPPANLMLLLTAPWMILFFISESPLIHEIRVLYLSFVGGMCCYWTYYETVKKSRL